MPKASAAVEIKITGIKASEKAIESFRSSIEKLAGSFSKNFAASSQKTQRETDRLSKSFFKVRDHVELFSGSLNRLSNSIFIFFRRLARIRTAIFILITFLAVRQIVDFIKSLKDFSLAAEISVQRLAIRFENIKKAIGDYLAPIIDSFDSFFDRALKAISAIINSQLFSDLVTALFYVGNVTKNLLAVFVNFFNLVRVGFTILADDIYMEWLRLLQEIEEAVNKIAKSFHFDPIDIFDVNDLKQIGVLEREIRNLEPEMHRLGEAFLEAGRALGRSLVTSGAIEYANKVVAELKKIIGVVINVNKNIDDSGNQIKQFLGGFGSGLNKFASETIRDLAKKLGEGVADAVNNAFGESFLAIMQGRFNDLRDIVVNFLQDIQRALAQFAAQQVTEQLLSVAVDVLKNAASYFNGASDVQGTNEAYAKYSASSFDFAKYSANTPSYPIGNVGPQSAPSVAPSTGAGKLGNVMTPYQHGGVAFSSRVGLFAEAGPEAVIPLKGGKVPVQLSGGRSGVTVVIAPQVIDGPSFGSWLEKEKKTIYRIMAGGISGGSSVVRSSLRTHFGKD